MEPKRLPNWMREEDEAGASGSRKRKGAEKILLIASKIRNPELV